MDATNARIPKRLWIPGALLLLFHGVWLCWSATWQSPTLNEPGQLASGIANWTFNRFEPASVNPPTVRMIATIPIILQGCRTNWDGLSTRPGDRCEGQLGVDFARANGQQIQHLTVMSRWMLVPVSLLGGFLVWRWSTQLFGSASGFLALWLWCFDPNVIAHGQLVTNDLPATTAGLAAAWACWNWLRHPQSKRAIVAGVALGFALLAKFTWVILVPLWLFSGIASRYWSSPKSGRPSLLSLVIVFVLPILVVNSGYAWQNVFRPLGSFRFSSAALRGGDNEAKCTGNRFAESPLGMIRVPIPADYLLGLDQQWHDLESSSYDSYLSGRWKRGGWWYYYLYGAAVKWPVGLIAIATIAVARGVVHWIRGRELPDGVLVVSLVVPAIALFAIVSSQTGFSHHFRYVLPCLGPVIILSSSAVRGAGPILLRGIWAGAISVSISSLVTAPHSLAYFNEIAGGMTHGHEHLLHSNLDWGQDLVSLKRWIETRGDGLPVYVAYYGFLDPLDYGIPAEVAPFGPIKHHNPRMTDFGPGWYAISANYVFGCEWGLADRSAYRNFRYLQPEYRCGGSILIYRLR